MQSKLPRVCFGLVCEMTDVRNLLDLVFSTFDGIDIKNAEFGVVTSDYYVLFPSGRLLQNQVSYILFKSVKR
jgi:hypothetical protein